VKVNNSTKVNLSPQFIENKMTTILDVDNSDSVVRQA
jgi:hypothetical protein